MHHQKDYAEQVENYQAEQAENYENGSNLMFENKIDAYFKVKNKKINAKKSYFYLLGSS